MPAPISGPSICFRERTFILAACQHGIHAGGSVALPCEAPAEQATRLMHDAVMNEDVEAGHLHGHAQPPACFPGLLIC
jgi:hypothetical protein